MTINEIALEHYLILSSLLFSIGVTGLFMNRKNVITILMSIELMLLAVNLNFVAFSVHLQDIVGQIFSLIILSIAAAEVSIGLAILVLYFRNRGSIEIEDINQMKG
jgi:NADH-quinone oxidoreductase subunit K